MRLKDKIQIWVIQAAFWKTGGCPFCAIVRAFVVGAIVGALTCVGFRLI